MVDASAWLPRTVLERRSRVLTLWQHRSTSLGWLFLFLVSLAGGFLCGLFLPLSNLGAASGAYSVSSSVDSHSVARDICYWAAYLSLCFRYVPQIVLNQTRGRSLGLCIDAVIWDVFANSCLTLATLLRVCFLSQLQPGPATHGDARDVCFAVLVEAQCCLLLAQCWVLDGTSLQRPSPTPLATASIFVLLSVVYLIIMTAGRVDMSIAEMLSNWTLVLQYAYICATLLRFLPQLVRNRKYRLFFGWDAASLAMELLGGAALVLFVLLGSPAAFGGSDGSGDGAAALGWAAVADMDKVVLGAGLAAGAGCLLADLWMFPKVPESLVAKRTRRRRRRRSDGGGGGDGSGAEEEDEEDEEEEAGRTEGREGGGQGAAVEAWVLDDDEDEDSGAGGAGGGAWAVVQDSDDGGVPEVPVLTLNAVGAFGSREDELLRGEAWEGEYVPPAVVLPLRHDGAVVVVLGGRGGGGGEEGGYIGLTEELTEGAADGAGTWQTRVSETGEGEGTYI